MTAASTAQPSTATDPALQIDGDTLTIDFIRFDAASYQLFLKAKRLPEYKIDIADADDLTYRITTPARFAGMLGVPLPPAERTWLSMPDFMFDDQKACVELAIAAKRFAIWSGTGNGKTFMEAEFARQVSHATGGRVLIVTMAAIVPQWVEMIRDRYGDSSPHSMPVAQILSRDTMKEWCQHGTMMGEPIAAKVAIVNYEKFNHKHESEQVVNELRHLAGIVLDESSKLAAGGGKQKWAIVKSTKGIEFKLSCTATPAPNDYMEFASQASFLEKLRDQNEILWTYFTRDPKTHRWTIKPHAREAFYQFMAGWSIYVNNPKTFGWRKGIVDPPEPEYLIHEVPITKAQRDFITQHNFAESAKRTSSMARGRIDRSGTPSMFAEEVNATSGAKLNQAAKGFVYVGKSAVKADDAATSLADKNVQLINSMKPVEVARIARNEVAAGLQVLIWTVFDAETEILAKLLRKRSFAGQPAAPVKFECLTGATPERKRPAILERFRTGELPVLIGRTSMLGFGMNFQNCGAMIFSGWTFSFLQFYQAVRRAYRYGQTRSVRVHIPIIRELEGQMWDAICRKDNQHLSSIVEMERNYIAARQAIGGRVAAA